VLVGEFLPTHESYRAISGRKFGDSRLQRRAGASPDDHAHFKPFLWVGWGEYLRALHCSALAAFESNFSHDFIPRDG
jgi:hypothetical protein